MARITLDEVRKRYLDFFKSPPRSHALIPSASLVPENDPTTLFTSSGMQPLVPYLLGQPHPAGKRLVNSQKSFRAEDIEEVGDNRHTTFFEMLGNWSLGDYWKEDQLAWFFGFLTERAGIAKERLAVTCFEGDPALGLPRDEESAAIWKKLGIPDSRIYYYGAKKNWWSRSGAPEAMPAGEPGGTDSEVFYEFADAVHDKKYGEKCHPNCDCGRFMEIGNSVFMEYRKTRDGRFERLPQRNVDFGGGLERITAAANGQPDIFGIDVFEDARRSIEAATKKKYADRGKEFRVVMDHVRAAVLLVADGVVPSNTERGYMLRRLLRRAAFFADKLGDAALPAAGSSESFIAHESLLVRTADIFVKAYGMADRAGQIVPEVEKEERRFRETLARGMKEFQKVSAKGAVTGADAFVLFTTYGFPFELTAELSRERGIVVDAAAFAAKMKEHRDLSSTASAGMFRGGLADHSAETVRLHTAHHLLLKALQTVLGSEVKQRGSNITAERLRLDFSHGAKLSDAEKREVERIVNEKIAEALPVIRSEMPREEAEKLRAEHEFGQKYPDRVSVYSIGPKGATAAAPQFDKAFSIEFCGGPHVANTKDLAGVFRILKEEAVSRGVRRIKASVGVSSPAA